MYLIQIKTHGIVNMFVFVRIIFRLCTLLVRWDTHPVSKYSLRTVMQIPIVGLRYIYVYMCTYISIYVLYKVVCV